MGLVAEKTEKSPRETSLRISIEAFIGFPFFRLLPFFSAQSFSMKIPGLQVLRHGFYERGLVIDNDWSLALSSPLQSEQC